MSDFKNIFITALFGVALIAGLGASAVAEMETSILFVAPHRVLIEPTEKTEIINVANKSDVTRRYDITLIDQVMNDQGQTQRQETFDYSVKRMVKFVPKRFTLKPGERQVVRVQVTDRKALTDGDYHSHLLFREVPLNAQDKAGLQAQRLEAETGKKAVSFEIRALYGIAVPIILQNGKIEWDLALGDASLTPATESEPNMLNVRLDRTGNSEAAGLISASYTAPAGGTPVEVLKPLWLRVYREVAGINKKINLDLPEGTKFEKGGKIKITLVKKQGVGDDAPETTVEKEIIL